MTFTSYSTKNTILVCPKAYWKFDEMMVNLKHHPQREVSCENRDHHFYHEFFTSLHNLACNLQEKIWFVRIFNFLRSVWKNLRPLIQGISFLCSFGEEKITGIRFIFLFFLLKCADQLETWTSPRPPWNGRGLLEGRGDVEGSICLAQ